MLAQFRLHVCSQISYQPAKQMKKYFKCRQFYLFFVSILLMPVFCTAQSDFPHDTAYYETFPRKLTVRIYTSRKYIHLHLPPIGSGPNLEYEANPKLNLGAGFSYRNLSLNLFYGFSFLNPDDAKGRTKGLDIQLHVYPKKWSIDVLGIFPRGYHLEPKGFAAANNESYYYRPDMKQALVGIAAYRVPNKERFSYRAAIIQTEWQKKSAGSLLYGGEAYYGSVKADSSFVPYSVKNEFPQSGINNISFVRFGPGAGYAYTLVVNKHFFATASLIGNLDLSFTTEKGIAKQQKFALSPTVVFKSAIGYNSANWNVSANLTGLTLWIRGASTEEHYYWPLGNYRFVVAKKFNLKAKSHHS